MIVIVDTSQTCHNLFDIITPQKIITTHFPLPQKQLRTESLERIFSFHIVYELFNLITFFIWFIQHSQCILL